MIALLLPTLVAPLAAPAQTGDALRDQVRARIADWAGNESAGGAVCVLRGGEPILVETFGMADLESGAAITPDTPFYIASCAKPITAFCATHAAVKGDLDLDAPLSDLFPDLHEAVGAATLRQAMHHTSGVPDVYDATVVADLSLDAVSSNAAALELIERFERPCFEPGSRFLYCNSGYVLLAEALRRATGKTLAEYAGKHVFGAFGMESARFLGDAESGPTAAGYRRSGGGWTPRAFQTGLHGPGGVFASLNDLVAFERGLRDTVGPDLRRALGRPIPHASHPRLGAYGAGWMLGREGGLRTERHFGGAFGFSADLLRFPDQDVVVIALSNASDLDAPELSLDVARIVLADEMQESAASEAIELTAEQAGRFKMLWRSEENGAPWILSRSRTGYTAAALGDVKLELVPVGPTRLEAPSAQIPFALELDGDALLVHAGDRRPERLIASPFPPRDLAPAPDHAGAYACEALEATIQLTSLPGERLRLEQTDPLIELPPFMRAGPDHYICDLGAQIDFHRDESGAVIGLSIWANRAWGLEFAKID